MYRHDFERGGAVGWLLFTMPTYHIIIILINEADYVYFMIIVTVGEVSGVSHIVLP